MTLAELRELFLAEQTRRGRDPITLKRQKRMLGKVLTFFDEKTELEQLTAADWQSYRLSVTGAPTSRAEQIREVQSWLRWGLAEGHLWRNPLMAVREAPVQAPVGWVPTIGQVRRLLELPGQHVAGQRDLAILELLYGGGFRNCEMNRLQMHDWQPALLGLWVRQGKGKKDRFQPIGVSLARRLNDYLENVRPLLQRSPEVAGLLLTNQGRTLSTNFVANCVRQYAQSLNLPKLTPRALRRAFATHMLECGAKLHEVQALLSHKEPGTSERYTQIERMELIREYRRTHPRARRKPGAGAVSR